MKKPAKMSSSKARARLIATGLAILCALATLALTANAAQQADADQNPAGVIKNLVLFRGDPIEAIKNLTFDGSHFSVPGLGVVPRTDVQQLEFRLPGPAHSAAAAGSAQALSPLAQEKLEAAAEMARQHPGVPGIVLVDDGEFTLRPDGSYWFRYHFAGLVLKEEQKNWAHVSVSFTEGRARANLIYARSVADDGSVAMLDPEELKIASPTQEMVFFNPHLKSLSGMIPNVEVGSVVEYEYEYEYYNPEDPRLFSPRYRFQGSEPVMFSRVKVNVPEGTTYNYVTRHFPDPELAEPVIEQRGGTKTYSWTLEDMPPIITEPLMPPMEDITPMMASSVFESHDDVYEMLRQLQTARITLTPRIEAEVKRIIEGAESIDEKIARIYHWVQERIRYISIKGSLGAGFSGHTAEETFENRYGDCTDKATIFATMLKAIGVESFPIIVMTNDAGTAITEIPTLSGNHAISQVCLGDRSFYLDTTAQDYRYPYFRADDHDIPAMNAIRGEIGRTPLPPPSDNRRVSRLQVKLNPEGDVVVKTSNEYNGNVEAGVRGFWKSAREDSRPMLMAEYVNSISPGALLDEFTLSNLDDLAEPLLMTLDYQLPGHAIRSANLMYLTMPTLERSYGEVALESRKYPIQYRTTEQRILQIDLELPEGFKLKWAPPPLEIKNPYIEYAASYEERGGYVVFIEDFQRLERMVPPSDYDMYRDALRDIAAFSKKEIFITDED